jgi:hypothetical protein
MPWCPYGTDAVPAQRRRRGSCPLNDDSRVASSPKMSVAGVRLIGADNFIHTLMGHFPLGVGSPPGQRPSIESRYQIMTEQYRPQRSLFRRVLAVQVIPVVET